jgi:hypothetical protein
MAEALLFEAFRYRGGAPRRRTPSSRAAALPPDAWEQIARTLRGADRRACACACASARLGVDASDASLCALFAPGLNAEQRRVFASVALRRLSSYVIGHAGVGKTHTLRCAVHRLVLDGATVRICAPTAAAADRAAAHGVEGQTVHALFQLRNRTRGRDEPACRVGRAASMLGDGPRPCPRADLLADCVDDKEEPGQLPTACLGLESAAALRDTDVVLLDEVSMLSPDAFDAVVQALELCCSDRGRGAPFGGKALVCCGDFAQLAPVSSADASEPGAARYAFERPRWAQLRVLRLVEQHRQADRAFARLCARLRDGRASDADCEWLVARSARRRWHDAPVAFFPRRADAARRNALWMARQPGPLHAVPPERHVSIGADVWTDEQDARARVGGRPLRFPNEPPLELKVGCRVRATRNVMRAHQGETRRVLTNGRAGTVTATDGATVRVRWDGDEDERVVPHVWRARQQPFEAPDGGGAVVCYVRYLPLTLGWASTVHAAQGASVDAELDLGVHPFAHGQMYTALSRATAIEHVRFLGPLRKEMFVCDPRVRAYHERLGV